VTHADRSGTALTHDRRQALKSARGKVLQRLFAYEYVSHQVLDPDVLELLRWEGGDPMANAFADRLYAEVLLRLESLDERIREFSRGWSLERLSRVDRNILRMALCEILHDPEIPFRVSVNEALEVAHQFSEPEAVSFINGILHEAAVKYAPEKGPYDPASSRKTSVGRLSRALGHRGRKASGSSGEELK
jgi:N utilization substance protein B